MEVGDQPPSVSVHEDERSSVLSRGTAKVERHHGRAVQHRNLEISRLDREVRRVRCFGRNVRKDALKPGHNRPLTLHTIRLDTGGKEGSRVLRPTRRKPFPIQVIEGVDKGGRGASDVLIHALCTGDDWEEHKPDQAGSERIQSKASHYGLTWVTWGQRTLISIAAVGCQLMHRFR